MQHKISLVVLTYNGWAHTHQLLLDIRNNCPDVHEVLVVDNGSEDPAVDIGLRFWEGLECVPLTVATITKNIGFVGGMNYGLKSATGDIIVAISNDVRILSNEFIPEVQKEFSADPAIVLGPTLYTTDTGWNKFGERIIPYVEGWCIACHKYVWNTLGLFNPQYAPSDYEDVDFSYKAVSQGAKLVQLRGGLIQHLGAKTYGYNPERLARTQRNRKIFAEHWGLVCE